MEKSKIALALNRQLVKLYPYYVSCNEMLASFCNEMSEDERINWENKRIDALAPISAVEEIAENLGVKTDSGKICSYYRAHYLKEYNI